MIFKVYLKNIKKVFEIDVVVLVEMILGFVGVDIVNVCNEVVFIVVWCNKKVVDMDDFNYVLDKVIGGLECKMKLILLEEKKIIVYYEVGYVVCGWFLEYVFLLVKVIIVFRGIGMFGYV